MNVDLSMCASSDKAAHRGQVDWPKCERPVRRLQARIVKVARRGTGSAHAELCGGLSRMRGNSHVRFSGEGVAATPLPYPTCDMKSLEQLFVMDTS